MKPINAFTMPETAEALAKSFDEQAARLKAEFDALSQAELNRFIITVADLPMSVHGEKPTWVPLRDATRFDIKSSAEQTARRLVNGAGDRGVVRVLGLAYEEAWEQAEQFAADIRKGNNI